MKDHVVVQGECISSIAFDHGLSPDTVWNHPNNAELRSERKNPNVLLPNDVVHVPDVRIKIVQGATGKRHTFRLKSVPSTLDIRFAVGEKPRSGLSYVLTVDGADHAGTTDDDGRVKEWVMPDAQSVTLELDPGDGGPKEAYEILTRQLDPVEEVSGQQARLKNLGYFAGEITGTMDDATTSALQLFQNKEGLPPSDEADAATCDALRRAHGC
jgi:Putative peptidoglycan binding domain